MSGRPLSLLPHGGHTSPFVPLQPTYAPLANQCAPLCTPLCTFCAPTHNFGPQCTPLSRHRHYNCMHELNHCEPMFTLIDPLVPPCTPCALCSTPLKCALLDHLEGVLVRVHIRGFLPGMHIRGISGHYNAVRMQAGIPTPICNHLSFLFQLKDIEC